MKDAFDMAIRARKKNRATALLIVAALGLSACATTATPTSSAHIEIQESIGFTITEEARISSNVRTDYESALTLLEQGRQEEGIALLEEVAESAPQFSAPRIDLGIAYHRAGDLQAAERNLMLALALNADHPIAHNELGIVHRKAGRFDEARRSYEAALAIYPGYHFARRNLAVLCDLYLADIDCALQNYEAYMTTVPNDEDASMWIADLRMRRGTVEE
jgi:Flp pilus assembly protein TadD